jgi:hypothetical protein
MAALNHADRADSRIINEYRQRPKFNAWAKTIPNIADRQFEPVIQTLLRSYDPDTATGELLDIIGRIVGAVRPITRITDVDVFGYEGNPSYVNYNVAPYIGDGSAAKDLPLSDDLYRVVVKAKIARNIRDGTYDSIVTLTEFILGFAVTAIIDYGNMTFRLGFEREPSLIIKFLLDNFDMIPRPQGVEMLPYFILPKNIDAIEASSTRIFNYSNYTLPGDVQ